MPGGAAAHGAAVAADTAAMGVVAEEATQESEGDDNDKRTTSGDDCKTKNGHNSDEDHSETQENQLNTQIRPSSAQSDVKQSTAQISASS